MTGKELIKMLQNLTEEEQNYPVGYWIYWMVKGSSGETFTEYNDFQIVSGPDKDHDGCIIYTIGLYLGAEEKK